MKGLYGSILLCFGIIYCSAQTTGEYRTFQSGDWNNLNTWERYNGTSWVNPAPSAPLNTSAAISVRNGHIVTVTANTNGDQLRVNDGGTLIVNSGVTFTVWSGSGDDLTVDPSGVVTILDNGILTIRSVVAPPPPGVALVRVYGTINNAGFIANASSSTLIFEAESIYNHQFTTAPGEIPAASWNENSNCRIVGYTSNAEAPAGLGQSFGNFLWDTALAEGFIDLNGALETVNGNLTIQNYPSSYIYLTSTTDYTLNVGGDLLIQNSTIGLNSTATAAINVLGNALFADNSDLNFTFDGNFTLDVGGRLEFSGGTVNFTYNGAANIVMRVGGDFELSNSPILNNGGTGSKTLTFDGSTFQSYIASEEFTDFSFVIQNSSKVQVGNGNHFSGSGDFTLEAGGTLAVGDQNGLTIVNTTGNVRVTGDKVFQENSNIIYNGTIAQNLGDEWGPNGALNGTAVNLEISNSLGVTNDIVGSTSLVGKLILTNGPLNIGISNTLIIEGDFEGYNGTNRTGTISGHMTPTPTSNLEFSGSGILTGTLNFTAGANSLRNFTINRAGSVNLGTDLTIASGGILAFQSTGSLAFDQVSGQTLTINGNITQSGPGGLSSGTALPANLVIGGSGMLTALPFCTSCGTMQLNNVSLNRTGGASYPWNSSVRISGVFNLTSGTLAHSSGIIMLAGSTFRRSSGTTVTLNSPTPSPSYNIEYIGNLTTSLEMPSGASALNNLTIAGDVMLNKQIRINGDLSITSGEFNTGAFNLIMAGENFLVGGGAFTMAADKTITFARSGTTTMGGETIDDIQFGNVTINSGAVVSAPDDNINIAGTWNNSGIFEANAGTVTFNGGDQGLDPNGQPFFNVTFAGTGTKELQGTLDVDGTLTISSILDVGNDELIRVGGAWTNNGTFVASGGTVMFDGTSQVIDPTGQPFYNLVLDNGGTKTLASAINIDGSLTISDGVTLDVGTNYAINLAGEWINDGTFVKRSGTVIFDGTTTIGGNSQTAFHGVNIAGSLTVSPGITDVSGTWLFSSGSFNPNGGTVRFNGAGQNINPGTQAFHNVVIAGSNNKMLLSNLDVNGDLTLTAGLLDVTTSNRTIFVAGNFSATAPTRLNAQSGLVVFDGTNQSITSGGISFHHAEFSNGGTKTLLDAFRANGNMDINVALAAGSNAITVGGNWDAQGGSFTTTGTTTFNGTTQTIRSNGSSFGTVVLAGTGTKSLQDALDVNGNLTVTSTLDVTTGNFAVATAGDWNLSSGTFMARAGSVTLDGTTQNIFQGATNPFNHLVIAGSGTKTQQDALDVNGNLSINTGAGLDAGADFGIALAGNFTANGSYVPGASTLTLDGSTGQSIGGSTPANFYNINVDKSSADATITAAHSLTNTLTLIAGNLNANGMLTLVSSATGDARIAPVPEGSAILGNVIAQRYLPNTNSSRAYRYLASPVTNAFVSDWKNEFPITGTFNDPSTGDEWPGIPGPAIMSATPSMFVYDEALGGPLNDRYASYPLDGTSSSASPIVNGRGYAAFVRQSTPVVLNVRGTPRQGDVPVNVTSQGNTEDDGWNLIGNPYASPINWDNVNRPAGVGVQIAMMDNTNNLGLGAGEYVYYTQNGIGIPQEYDGTIAQGQAFWVRATSNSTITFQEDDKEPVSSPDFIREAPLKDLLRINIAGNNRQDELVIHFTDDATDASDADFDAHKLNNSFINLSSFSSDSIRMAINVLGSLSCSKEIGLALEGVSAGAYTFNFSQFESFGDRVELRLLDNYTGTTFNIRNEGPLYEFSVSADANSFGKKRFKLYVTYPEVTTDLALSADDVCVGSPAAITIQRTQEGVKYYSTLNGNTVSEEVISTGGDVVLTIPHGQLKEGENALVLMASVGGCSAVPLDRSATVVSEAMYSITSASNGKSCGEGQVSLVAEGAPASGSYRWYESLDSTTPIAGQVAAEFITPVLSKTHTYYVAAVNSLGCEGARKEVIADVSYVDEVAIAIDELQLTSSYAEGNQWFLNGTPIEGATSQSLPVTETGLYEVEVSVNGCTTRASQEMIVLGSEFGAGSGISFYPNPVAGILQIELPESTPASGLVQSAVGSPVGEVTFTTSQGMTRGEFNFEGHAAGLYLIRVLQGNKIIHYKIIKK